MTNQSIYALNDPLETPIIVSDSSPIPSGSITVTQFIFTDNTVFSAEELGKIFIPETSTSIASVTPENPLTLTFPQLLQIATQVADYYAQEGYQTSGAIISIPQPTQQTGNGEVIIKVIEGKLQEINITLADTNRRGKLGDYVRSRLGVDLDTPLNVNRLLKALQLLQLDPLIQSISAQLSAGSEPNTNILNVSYRSANTFNLPIFVDNGRSPSIGTVERGIGIEENNLTGLGDTIGLNYINTDGSDRLNFLYEVPFNPNNTIRLEYTYNYNEVIEPPFDDIDLDGNSPDITSNFESYDFIFQHSLLRLINNETQTYSELNLGVNASWRRTQSFLFGEPFPFALSADVNGNTRIFALRFSQDYSQQSPRDVLAFRSEFSLGLNAFGSTVVENFPGIEVIPDSRFFAWRGQMQYVRVWQPDILFLVRSNIQLADPLVPIEQFSIGGLNSVRGYRQDQVLTDNGFFFSTETRFSVLRTFGGQGVLQLIPFIDYGVGWNSSSDNPSPNNLASVGVGLLYQQGNFTARLDWGIPLIDVSTRKRTWQENGLYFTIQYNLF